MIRPKERGSALVEFALCVSIFWLPLFLGTMEIGLSLRRAIQVTQVCRDVAHMYGAGVDFSQTSAQTLLQSIAPGIDFSSTSTTAVIILSTILYGMSLLQSNSCAILAQILMPAMRKAIQL